MRVWHRTDTGQSHPLTSPMNQAPLRANTAPATRARPQAHVRAASLDQQLAGLREELRFTSAVPIGQWVRQADVFKRQADQHHTAGDLEGQYMGYVRATHQSCQVCTVGPYLTQGVV